MSSTSVQMISDLMKGMDESCYRYDVEEIFGLGENRLLVELLQRVKAEESDKDHTYER